MKLKKYASLTVITSMVISCLITSNPNVYVNAEDNIQNQQVNVKSLTNTTAVNNFEPTKITVLTQNPITDKESVGFMPATNINGISDYLLFYSRYDKSTVESVLKNYTYSELIELDKEGVDKAKLVPVKYADGYGNSFYSGQKDIVDGRIGDISKNVYHIYVASIGENGVMAIGEGDKTTGKEDLSVLSTAMNSVNNATDDGGVQKALDVLQYDVWSQLSGDAKIYDAIPSLTKQKPEGGFKDVKAFEKAVCLSISLAYTNDVIYDYESPIKLVEGLEKLNPKNFAFLSPKYKIALATSIINGNKDDMYGGLSDYEKVLNGGVQSIAKAIEKNPVSVDKEYLIGKTYKLKDFYLPTDNDEIYWESSDLTKATVNRLSGEITPKSMGDVIINYTVVNKTTKEIKAYGNLKITVKDNITPKTILPTLEAGKVNSLMITFDEEMSENTRKITNTKDLIENIRIGTNNQKSVKYTVFEDIEGNVEWYSNRLAKVTFTEDDIQLQPGEVVAINYIDKVTDVAGNTAETYVSEAVTKDTSAPIGKIKTPEPKSNKVTITFSEQMNDSTTQATKAYQIINKLEVYNNKKLVTTLYVGNRDLKWNEDKTELWFNTYYQFKDGDYIKPTYSSNVADISGNKISNTGKSIIIGGALKSDNMGIYGEMRNLGGGKLPKIAIVGSSKEKFADALDVWHRDDPAGLAYMHEYSIKGFEPVFIPIAQDFCKDGDKVVVDGTEYVFNEKEVIEALDKCEAIFLQGGDQAKHAMSFLKDDGSDTNVMAALRQIVASGGMVSGSSAGNHIQSDIMFGGGYSYDYLVANGLYNKTTGELREKDWFGLDNGTMTKGFGFAPDSVVTDSHFDNRGRMGRLMVALRDTNKKYGIGIDENTAIVFEENWGKVLGTEGVFILDRSNATFSPTTGTDFKAENVRVSYLTDGDKINLITKEIKSSKVIVNTNDKEVYNSENIFDSKENTKVLTSLVGSKETKAQGKSKEQDPQFIVTYEKDKNTKLYNTKDMVTIDNAKISITK